MLTKIRRLLDFGGLTEKLNEAITAVIPIMLIVLFLAFFVVPMPTSILMAFLFGSLMLIVGMTLFSLGAEMAMGPIGSAMGSAITRTKKIWFILLMGFVLGTLITVSEPDLQVLASQITSIPSNVIIVSVAVGTGLFLMLALVRTFLGFPLRYALFISYALVFILLIFTPQNFVAVSFDAGGVTTGPMTVPFIMAFGVGISSFRNDKSAKDDSFGVIAMSSVGPIIAVLILAIIYRPENATYKEAFVPTISDSMALSSFFGDAIPTYVGEMFVSMLPIVALFIIFDIATLRMHLQELTKIAIGLVYTYAGLVIFLTGVNVGFMPAGSCLGSLLAEDEMRKWAIIPIGMLIGFFIVKAEPAVYVFIVLQGDIRGILDHESAAVKGLAGIGAVREGADRKSQAP